MGVRARKDKDLPKVPPLTSRQRRAEGTNKLQDRQKEERRTAVAALYCEGVSIEKIAETLDTTTVSVFALIREVRIEWLRRSIAHYDQRKAEELAKVDRLEAEAWEAWHRSCAAKTIERTRTESVRQVPPRHVPGKTDGQGVPSPPPKAKRNTGKHVMIPIRTTTEVTIHGQTGDPRFLEQIAWCIETRLRVLGALKPDTTNVQITQINWAEMTAAPPSHDAVEEVIDTLERQALVTPHPSSPSVLNALPHTDSMDTNPPSSLGKRK